MDYRLRIVPLIVMLLSGCHEQRGGGSPNDTVVTGAMTSPKAMSAFYGNYDPKRQASMARLTTQSNSIPTEQWTVRPLFNAFYNEPSGERFVLVTSAVPSSDESYYCHACAPTIGVAVFERRKLTWSIEAANQNVAEAGEFGKPPTNVELVEIGPKHSAIAIKDEGGGQGEYTTVLTILVPWNRRVGVGLERVIADDNRGACDPKDSGALPCYANKRSIAFLRNDKSQVYDLQLTLSGTDMPLSDDPSRRIRQVHGKEKYEFRDGKYIQISRDGDITSLDRFVADSKGRQ